MIMHYQRLRFTLFYVFFFVLVWVLTPSMVNACEWVKSYGGSSGEDQARAIRQTRDGGYVVAGWTESFGAGGADVLVVKLDKNGLVEWAKTYGGAEQDRAFSIQQTSDGGYIVAGESSSFSDKQTLDIWVLKLSMNGDIEWQKRYHQRDNYLNEGAYSAIQTSDGGYMVVGFIQSNSGGYGDIITMKLANDGSIVWQKDIGKKPEGSYSYDPHDDVAYSVEQTSDGGYIIAGKTTASLTWTPVPWIIKLSSTCEIQWNKQFPYKLDENGKTFSIKQTSEGGYIYTAPWFDNGSLIMKLNADGNPVWGEEYSKGSRDSIFDIDRTNDGGYIVVGRSNSFSGTIATEAWLLKLYDNGSIQWQKQYGDAHHNAMGFAVQQTSDGGYVIAGMSSNSDFWVFKD